MARPPKFDDDEILDRAMATMWQHGWAQTSIRDLEGALDLKAPSIYRRFGTKEGLATAVVDHYVEHVVRRRIDKHLRNGARDPIDNIARFLERSVTQAGDGGRLWGCLLTTASLENGDPDPAFAESLARGFDLIEDGFRSEVLRAADLGRLADAVEPDAAAATLTLVMQGLMALARGGAPPSDLRRRARAAVSMISGGTPGSASRSG